MLWGLSASLTPTGFDTLQQWFANIYVKLLIWAFLAPFCFHLVAGVRHLLSDIHIGVSLKGGRLSAVITFIVSIILVLLVGIWLW